MPFFGESASGFYGSSHKNCDGVQFAKQSQSTCQHATAESYLDVSLGDVDMKRTVRLKCLGVAVATNAAWHSH